MVGKIWLMSILNGQQDLENFILVVFSNFLINFII